MMRKLNCLLILGFLWSSILAQTTDQEFQKKLDEDQEQIEMMKELIEDLEQIEDDTTFIEKVWYKMDQLRPELVWKKRDDE